MRVSKKSVDGLRKKAGQKRAGLKLTEGLKWYWQRAQWWISGKWIDARSESVKIEEQGINSWQDWLSGVGLAHDDFKLLIVRLGEVLWDGSIDFSEKRQLMLRKLK